MKNFMKWSLEEKESNKKKYKKKAQELITQRETGFELPRNHTSILSMDILPPNILRSWQQSLGQVDENLVAQEVAIDVGSYRGAKIADIFLSKIKKGEHITLFGLRYRYGYFKQEIQDGNQIETINYWTHQSLPFEKVLDEFSQVVSFNSQNELAWKQNRLDVIEHHANKVIATPYEYPYLREDQKTSSILLFKAKSYDGILDFYALKNARASTSYRAEDITSVLYPSLEHDASRLLYLKQVYLLVSASLQLIFNEYSKRGDIEDIAQDQQIIIADQDCSIAYHECMRILLDQYYLQWDQAALITNNLLKSMADQKRIRWDDQIISKMIPRIYDIEQELSRRNQHLIKKINIPLTFDIFLHEKRDRELVFSRYGIENQGAVIDVTLDPKYLVSSVESMKEFIKKQAKNPYLVYPDIVFIFGMKLEPTDQRSLEAIKEIFQLKKLMEITSKVPWNIQIVFIENITLEDMRNILSISNVLIGEESGVHNDVRSITKRRNEEYEDAIWRKL